MKMDSIYKKEFHTLVEKLAQDSEDYYIGVGNPNAKILIVGKEGVTEGIPENEISLATRWLSKVKANESIEFNFRNLDEKGKQRPFREGDTYSKYQKLHDYIFEIENKDRDRYEVDFFRNFFLTEMNVNRARNSKKASKSGMEKRKEEFFRNTEFIQQFPVVVLACGPYIDNRKKKEVDTLFGVRFGEEYRSDLTEGQKFWTHYNADKSKLVIHTRQLSSNVRNTLLEEMAKVIREFLESNNR